jgi:hypothetical protein
MTEQVSRRTVLRRSAEVAAAGAAATVLFNGSDAQAKPAPAAGRSPFGTVVRTDGATAEVALGATTVTVPVVGFPPRWQLRPGDRVAVGTDADTGQQAAQPLVTRLVGPIEKTTRSGRQTAVTVAGTTVVVDPATIRAGGTGRGVAGQYEAYYIGNDRGPTLRAVVLRPIG